MGFNVLAADMGYGWVKALLGEMVWRTPSVVGEPRQLLEDQTKPGDLIFNNQYFVGDLAIRQSEIRYAGTPENKAEHWTTKVLLQTALAALAPAEPVNMVTGLPLDYYLTQKNSWDALVQQINDQGPYLLGIVGGAGITAKPTIKNYKVVPQGFGAAMDYLLDDNGQLVNPKAAKERILVIDLGYYTLGMLVLDGMEISKESCSPALGTDTAYKVLQGYLKQYVGHTPQRYELDRYVREGEYGGYDIKPLVTEAFKALAMQVQMEYENLRGNFQHVLCVGGNIERVMDHVNIPNAVTLINPQLAQARGYGKIGARTWGKV